VRYDFEMNVREHLKGKKITVLGLGLLGRGVGDTKFLAECGADLIVTDLKTEHELASSLKELESFSNIQYVLGEHRLENFKDRDFVLKAAGVPLDSIYVAEAKKNGIPVKMSASWFMEFADVPVIGITGTRGKSTVTHMLHAILKEAGQDVLLGGNVRGVSTLALLNDVKEDSIALFELDSWQLQGFKDARLSPDIAVFTTFLDDHANYYKGDVDQYLADKANIFLNQDATDTLVLGEQCAELIEEKYGAQIKAHTVKAGAQDFRADWELTIPGEHNRYNAALAVEAARALDIDDEIIREALQNFAGVPGRLELIREKDGVKFYNDTTATTPDATIAALKALQSGEDPNIILIMGGADKGLSMRPLIEEVQIRAKKIILLQGTGTKLLATYLQDSSVYENLDAAVKDAVASAEEGDIILMSPGFASFGMFKNEYDRGDQFNAIVKAL
jgi:UDP-N-acetylmuramoylalanine--D-glutamate ligase